MNELPDVPRHTRPLPPDGVELAMRAGRRRRAVFLGTSGAAAAAVVLLIGALALQPSGSQSLQYADPDPTPTATVQPTSSASAEVAATSEPTPQPSDAGTPSPTSAPVASPSPTDSPEPQQQAREAYTETAQDEPAPLGCAEPPSGQTGPLVYGGASGCTTTTGGASSVKRGGSVQATSSLCAPYGGGDVVLGYDTGREHEVRVYDGSGELVYQFSKTVDYVQGAHERTMPDGRCLAWTGVWDTTLTNGELAPAGTYKVQITVRCELVNGRRTQPEEGASAEFPVTVE